MKAEAKVVEVYNSVGGVAYFCRMLDEWARAGWDVARVEAMSEQEYRRPRSVAGNLARRWRMYGGYAWQCWRAARRGRAHAAWRVVTTNPFFAPSLVAATAAGRGRTINLLYDLYPEALVQAGVIASGSLPARACAAITRHALRECAITVFLGERLRQHAEATYGAARRAVVIPVGADGAVFREWPPRPLPAGGKPRILYSGQMGHMHDIETLRAAWQDRPGEGVEWVFHASGAGYRRLQSLVGPREGVTWGGSLPEREWQDVMRGAQVALVTIAPGAERVVMPSKTYSALVAGQAVLAVCPAKSDLADLVRRHDCGWVVEPGDVLGLRAALVEMARDPAGLMAKRERAYEAGHREYDMGPVARRWLKLFDDQAGIEAGGAEAKSTKVT